MVQHRKVLLLEPNYKNKYPPIGLMKLATYHRMLGDEVVFYKGNLNNFIINELYDELIKKLLEVDEKIKWRKYKNTLIDFLKTGKKEFLEELIDLSNYPSLIENWLIYYRNYYRKKEYFKYPRWDRVCIATLFTFYWEITIATIEFAKKIVKDENQIIVGGVLATILAEDVERATGIKPFKGLLNKAGTLDDNKIVIDELPLDYSILDEIEYTYPEKNAYYGYMTRGCIRKCSFCAVWKIEPNFNPYISLKNKIKQAKEVFGEQRNLLLLDNNVLASKKFPKIIKEIKECGFVNGARFTEPNYLDLAISNLKKGINDKAYIKKSYELLHYLLNRLRGSEQQKVYNLMEELDLLNINTTLKENILKIYPEVKDQFEKYRNKSPKLRYVDFNQGVDARLITEEKMRLLSSIPIRPLRIAFDSMEYEEVYIKSIKLAAKYKITHLSNYILYNERDKPDDLYKRLEINILLSEELDINIYSFPMKFHPISGEKHLNRDYLGEYWNRKYIRAIQTILNATKGKVGRGKSFFYKAFGKNLDEYRKILLMPETYILYRFFFEDLGYTSKWWTQFNDFSDNDRYQIIEIVKKNNFNNLVKLKPNILNFIKEHYLLSRNEIINPKSKYYREKQEYDKRKNGKDVHLHLVQADCKQNCEMNYECANLKLVK